MGFRTITLKQRATQIVRSCIGELGSFLVAEACRLLVFGIALDLGWGGYLWLGVFSLYGC